VFRQLVYYHKSPQATTLHVLFLMFFLQIVVSVFSRSTCRDLGVGLCVLL